MADSEPEHAQELQNLFDRWDSACPDSMAGKVTQPRNRNKDYSKGHRTNVAEFNSKQK